MLFALVARWESFAGQALNLTTEATAAAAATGAMVDETRWRFVTASDYGSGRLRTNSTYLRPRRHMIRRLSIVSGC